MFGLRKSQIFIVQIMFDYIQINIFSYFSGKKRLTGGDINSGVNINVEFVVARKELLGHLKFNSFSKWKTIVFCGVRKSESFIDPRKASIRGKRSEESVGAFVLKVRRESLSFDRVFPGESARFDIDVGLASIEWLEE